MDSVSNQSDNFKSCKRYFYTNDIVVTFTKKDGTERVMRCTLREDAIPVYEKKTEGTKEKNDDVFAVFDLDQRGWRSFRWDSVTGIRIEHGL